MRSTRNLSATRTLRVRRAASGSLFDLAPEGVYRATSITFGPVVSYTTFSPLPHKSEAVYFLWHYPSTALERSVPRLTRGILPFGVRTFLPVPVPRVEATDRSYQPTCRPSVLKVRRLNINQEYSRRPHHSQRTISSLRLVAFCTAGGSFI